MRGEPLPSRSGNIELILSIFTLFTVYSAQSPPPYSPLPQGSSLKPTQSLNLPPDLAPTNYIHIKEKDHAVKRKILLDLNVPRPPASALPVGAQGEDTPHLMLDSHNGSVSGEIWVLRANLEDTTAPEDGKPARERAHLHLHSHNGAVKALVVRRLGKANPRRVLTDCIVDRQHLHPSMVEPRPFFSIEVRAHNGSVTITIPRSFRGQLTLHTDNGRVHLSPALAPRAATLSTVNGTHTYFVGERPSNGKWHTGGSEDGEEVDGLIGSSKNGSLKVSYDDEDVNGTKGPGVFSSLFKAMGF
jgi:hypothetical protein